MSNRSGSNPRTGVLASETDPQRAVLVYSESEVQDGAARGSEVLGGTVQEKRGKTRRGPKLVPKLQGGKPRYHV